ncbi:hypothetical protein T439DRAFT_21609 [Meredithblackwellia eburnea MCA 4105]
MLGDHGLALVVESNRSIQTKSLLPYNTATVRNVVRESHSLSDSLTLASEIFTSQVEYDRGSEAELTISALALNRNMRALLVYHQQRLETLQDKFWERGGVLRQAFSEEEAPETRKNMDPVDINFTQAYAKLCVDFKESYYGREMDEEDPPVQLMEATSLLSGGTTEPPPKEFLVSVRVIGEGIVLEAKSGNVLSLHKGSQYLVPYEDVEDMLVMGTVELIE